MKRILLIVLSAAVSIPAAVAQRTPAVKDPVSSAARQLLDRQSRNLIAAAEEMPEESYEYKPTPQQRSFGDIITHTAESNTLLCSRISGLPPKAQFKHVVLAQKRNAVDALRNSFDFCKEALDKTTDTNLGEQVEVFGGRKVTRATALFMLTNDWADHYSALATYLRLKGMLPPTARGEGQQGNIQPMEKKW